MTEREMEEGIVFMTCTVLAGQRRDHWWEMNNRNVYIHFQIFQKEDLSFHLQWQRRYKNMCNFLFSSGHNSTHVSNLEESMNVKNLLKKLSPHQNNKKANSEKYSWKFYKQKPEKQKCHTSYISFFPINQGKSTFSKNILQKSGCPLSKLE